jgi:hypothetical protein
MGKDGNLVILMIAPLNTPAGASLAVDEREERA